MIANGKYQNKKTAGTGSFFNVKSLFYGVEIILRVSSTVSVHLSSPAVYSVI